MTACRPAGDRSAIMLQDAGDHADRGTGTAAVGSADGRPTRHWPGPALGQRHGREPAELPHHLGIACQRDRSPDDPGRDTPPPRQQVVLQY